MMKAELSFSPPIMNAAGSLGFAPDPHGPVDIGRLGAFITNPVSIRPRTPAQGVRYKPFPGGFLLHTGHPNPGLSTVIRQNADRWKRSRLPVLVHLLCQSVDEVGEMVRRFEEVDGVAGLELGLSPDVEIALACALVQAAMGELPLIVRLPLERAVQLSQPIASAAPGVVFSLGPPRGSLPDPGAGLLRGRIYGPAVFPFALAAMQPILHAGEPVIGAGGIYSMAQAQAMLDAGAIGVQLDSVLWGRGMVEGAPAWD